MGPGICEQGRPGGSPESRLSPHLPRVEFFPEVRPGLLPHTLFSPRDPPSPVASVAPSVGTGRCLFPARVSPHTLEAVGTSSGTVARGPDVSRFPSSAGLLTPVKLLCGRCHLGLQLASLTYLPSASVSLSGALGLGVLSEMTQGGDWHLGSTWG